MLFKHKYENTEKLVRKSLKREIKIKLELQENNYIYKKQIVIWGRTDGRDPFCTMTQPFGLQCALRVQLP
jgi:hypothetical protein